MKNQHQLLNILWILFIFNQHLLTFEGVYGQTTANNIVGYLQASSSKNQIGGSNAKTVTYNLVDGLKSYTLNSDGTFAPQTGGTFFGVFAAQIGSPSRNGEGDVRIWTRTGNSNNPNSNSVQTVERGSTSVLVYQTTFEAPAGRSLSVVFSASTTNPCTSLGLIPATPENEPLVPGIISSVIQLSSANKKISYAELSSSQTQLGNPTSKVIRLDTIGGSNAIGLASAAQDGSVKFIQSGVYFVIACAQAGSINNPNTDGEVRLWMRLNQVNIPNSNTIQTIRNGVTAVLVSQGIIKVKANDELQLAFSSTNNKLGIIASTPANEPAVPSMIFSTFRLDTTDSSVAYTQLSSSNSQWGCLTPQVITLNNNDGSNRITNNNGVIRFQRAGTYFVMAAAQVGSLNNQGVGDVRLWMRLNAVDITNSNTIQTVNRDTAVLVSQSVLELQANDRLQLIFSTDVTKGTLGLVASTPSGEPTVPSMIFSAFQSRF